MPFLIISLVGILIVYWGINAIKKQNNEKKQIEARKEAARIEQEIFIRTMKEEARLREEELQKIREEQDRKIAEKDVAYDKMLTSIQSYPISVSNEKAQKIAISFINNLTYSTITAKSNMETLGNFVVIDTETTGLKITSDAIIEIAAIRFRNFQPVERFVSLLAPSKPIPEQITKINHITDEMVAGKPYFQQIAASLVEFIGDDNIVGHNLPFDLKFIVHYGADVTTKKRKYYDTLTIAQKTIKKVRMRWDKEYDEYVEDFNSTGISDYKLKTLCFYLGITYRDAHRAENDALATGFVFHKLATIRKGESL